MKIPTPLMRGMLGGALVATALLAITDSQAAPSVKRLTPPSALFSLNDPDPPYISRFLPGQRFDLQATISPDAGQTVASAKFSIDGRPLNGTITFSPATGLAPNSVVV